MQNTLIYLLASLFLLSCDTEHKGHTIEKFSGDYRYHNGIAEFFDCKKHKKYYVTQAGKYKKIKDEYQALQLNDNDDVYLKVEGYVKTEELMDGIASIDVFVITRFLSIDQTRGCELGMRSGF